MSTVAEDLAAYKATVDAKYRNTGLTLKETLAANAAAEAAAKTRDADPYFLPGVKMTVDGVEYPARSLNWVFSHACGCQYGVTIVCEESVTESAAWLLMCDTKTEVRARQKRGDTIALRPRAELDLSDCPHREVAL